MSIGPVTSWPGKWSVGLPSSGPASHPVCPFGAIVPTKPYLRLAVEQTHGHRVVLIMALRQPAPVMSPLAAASPVIDACCRSRSSRPRESKRTDPSVSVPTPTLSRRRGSSGFEEALERHDSSGAGIRSEPGRNLIVLKSIRGDRVP